MIVILLSISSYFMLTMIVPKGVCDEIERIVRKFVWGVHNGSSKTALVSWDSVCQPKSHGGLGLRQLKDHNISFLMKVGFNIISNTNALWIQVLRSKYRVPSGLLMTCQGVGVPFYGDPFLRPWVPEEIINKIIGVPPPHPSSSPDRIIWGATSTGSFSLKSAYEKVREGIFNLKVRPGKYHGSFTALIEFVFFI
ncbi:uncharacterized mitochondrial protein AtMg00310-like [Gossypium raimondii]|uniref:uncharacterized mitochondrial protein AtMg00310-like n=1 Tax=Gossypium raimondii TaxID=29730 RepID=UPI00227C5D6C|nr:uncharacterized mitochondrial protein AtMg00310-like [Gossypium raimondii]